MTLSANLAEVSVGFRGVVEHAIDLLTFQNPKVTVTGRPYDLRVVKGSEPFLAHLTVAPEVRRRRPFERHR